MTSFARQMQPKLSHATRTACKAFIVAGNTLTLIGCLGLLLVASGLLNHELFAIGISSGIRVIGSVAIAGCLLSAIGYGVFDYHSK